MMKRIYLGVLLVVLAVGVVLFARGRAPSTPRSKETPGAPAGGPASRSDGPPVQPPHEEQVAYDEDPAGNLRLEGQVIDAQDHPIAGAEVALDAHPRRRTTTEEDGSFAFDGLVAGRYRIQAHKADSYAGPVTVRLGDKNEPVILRFTQGAALSVTVLFGRSPVAKAEVALVDEPGPAASTGVDGVATLRGISRGLHSLVVQADGFARVEVRFESAGLPGTTEQRTVTLKAGAPVSGRVVDKSGASVAGALVRAIGSSSLFEWGAGEDVVSNAHGEWSIPAVAAGTFRASASDKRHAPSLSAPFFHDGKNPRTSILITLGDGARLRGRVVRKNGEALAAAVRVAPKGAFASTARVRQVFADDSGNFEITGLPRAQLEVVALHELATSAVVVVDMTERADQEITMTVDNDGGIAGVVVDADGAPLVGAQVTAVPELAGGKQEPSEARLRGPFAHLADSAGHFEIRGLPAGEYRVWAARTQRDATRASVHAKLGDHDLRLVIPREGAIKGRVLYPDGSTPDLFSVSVSVGLGTGSSVSGTHGAFRIAAPIGKVVLTVSGPTFVQRTVADLEVQSSADTDVGTITVERGRSVSGRVLDGNGTPVAGARVFVGSQLLGSGSDLETIFLPTSSGMKSATSGDDGGFVFAGAAAGPLVLATEHETQGRSTMVRISAGDESVTVDLVLRPLGSLEGHVTKAGKPLAALVMATSQQAAGGTLVVRSDSEGLYRFDKLAADTYVVSAMQGGRGALNGHAQVVTIEASHSAQLDLELPTGGVAVSIQASLPNGVPAMNAQLYLLSGAIRATRLSELNEAIAARGNGVSHQGFLLKGAPAQFTDVAPGAYTLCGVPLPAEITNPAALRKLLEKPDLFPVACAPQTVLAAPPVQEFRISLPGPPAL